MKKTNPELLRPQPLDAAAVTRPVPLVVARLLLSAFGKSEYFWMVVPPEALDSGDRPGAVTPAKSIAVALREAAELTDPGWALEIHYGGFCLGTYLCRELKADPVSVADALVTRYRVLVGN